MVIRKYQVLYIVSGGELKSPFVHSGHKFFTERAAENHAVGVVVRLHALTDYKARAYVVNLKNVRK